MMSERREFLAHLERCRNRRNVMIFIGVVMIVAAFLMMTLWRSAILPVMFSGAAGGILLYIAHREDVQMRSEYKNGFVAPFLKNVYPDLSYIPEEGMSIAEFKKLGLFQGGIDSYKSEDEISGKVGNVSVRFSEIKATRTEGSGKNRRTVVVFNGIIFSGEFNKNFNASLVVLPDSAEAAFGSMVGNFLQRCNLGREQLVKLEDPEFEKAFAVYGSDQQEARYLLSPSLMRRMLALRSKFNGKVYFSFCGNRIHVAIWRGKNILELPAWGRIEAAVLEKSISSDIDEMIAIAGDLDLETRIWSKI